MWLNSTEVIFNDLIGQLDWKAINLSSGVRLLYDQKSGLLVGKVEKDFRRHLLHVENLKEARSLAS